MEEIKQDTAFYVLNQGFLVIPSLINWDIDGSNLIIKVVLLLCTVLCISPFFHIFMSGAYIIGL